MSHFFPTKFCHVSGKLLTSRSANDGRIWKDLPVSENKAAGTFATMASQSESRHAG
jgi:hypothetical protein